MRASSASLMRLRVCGRSFDAEPREKRAQMRLNRPLAYLEDGTDFAVFGRRSDRVVPNRGTEGIENLQLHPRQVAPSRKLDALHGGFHLVVEWIAEDDRSPADPQDVAIPQPKPPLHPVSAQERSVARQPIVDHQPLAPHSLDFRMQARSLGIETQAQVGVARSADSRASTSLKCGQDLGAV